MVAGESLAQLERVQSALIGPELLFGIVLLVATFIGSLIIGLRASAPLELVHRRQVEFTADASHELRTPISVIEAEVELALSRNRASEEYREVLERIGGEGHRLRNIVDDLLWLARIDDERTAPAEGEEADLAAVATASVDALPVRRLGQGREPATGHRGGPPGAGDSRPERGSTAWSAFSSTTPASTPAGTAVSTCPSTSPATGWSCGSMTAAREYRSEQRQLVLDRFHRGTEAPGGTGLGLAIADSVVRATDGSWMIGDAPLGGARMEVSWRQAATGRSRSAGTAGLGQPAGDDRRFAEAHHLPVAGTQGLPTGGTGAVTREWAPIAGSPMFGRICHVAFRRGP